MSPLAHAGCIGARAWCSWSPRVTFVRVGWMGEAIRFFPLFFFFLFGAWARFHWLKRGGCFFFFSELVPRLFLVEKGKPKGWLVFFGVGVFFVFKKGKPKEHRSHFFRGSNRTKDTPDRFDTFNQQCGSELWFVSLERTVHRSKAT